MRARIAFGVVDAIAALLVAIGVFVALPARWWVVDAPAAIVIALLTGAGVGLVTNAKWGRAIARVASIITLVIGLVLIALLALSASYLAAIYGPVGHGGALIFALVIALALPYLVVFPAAQLVWLGPRSNDEPR